jgi:hypothetical protein
MTIKIFENDISYDIEEKLQLINDILISLSPAQPQIEI